MSDPIIVERIVAAPAPVVYRYLTESALWEKWQGTGATIDAVPGGIFRVVMPNGTTARGEFVALEPDRKVTFTWGWIDHPGVPPGSTTVEIELIEEDDGTLVRLSHHGLAPDEIPLHTTGWNHYLPRLATVAAGGDPGRDGGLGG